MHADDMLLVYDGKPVTEALKRCLAAGAKKVDFQEAAACAVELFGCVIVFRQALNARIWDTVSVYPARLPQQVVGIGFLPDGMVAISRTGPPVQMLDVFDSPMHADALIAGIDRLQVVRAWHGQATLPRYTIRDVLGTVVGASSTMMMGFGI